jgi:hypothetical protein
MKTVKFDEITGILRQLRLSVLHGLRDPATRDEALRLKLQLDDAIGCLELCERYHIRPDARVLAVPKPQTSSPSSEFRLVEDHESDRREVWTEVMFDGESIRPLPGSLLIERG